jgi:hypothetical protein
VVVVPKKNYLVSTKIQLGAFFDVPDEDVYIELRETDALGSMAMDEVVSGGNTRKIVEWFRENMPSLMVGHNLYKTETELMTAEEVATVVFSKLSMMMHVLNKYRDEVLFTLGGKSAGN